MFTDTAAPRTEYLLAPGVRLRWADGGLAATSAYGTLALPSVPPHVADALSRLNQAGLSEAELVDGLQAAGDWDGAACLYFCLECLQGASCLHARLCDGATPLLTAAPLSPRHRLDSAAPAPAGAVRLSRFALLRREGTEWILESPLSHVRLIVHEGVAWRAVGALGVARGPGDLHAAVPDASPATVDGVVRWLLAAGMAVAGAGAGAGPQGPDRQESHRTHEDPEGGEPEDGDPVLRQWEFHDLLFHSRSRMGRGYGAYGGNFRFLGRIPPLPAVREHPEGERVVLWRPDMEALAVADVTLTAALEARTSVRDYGSSVIDARRLGEFLYRVARVRTRFSTDRGEFSSRPYPSGGASYEMELYLTVDRCAGLAPGLYHYEPDLHALTRLSGPNRHTEGLLKDAWNSAARLCRPQVLITLAARFQRVAWKYDAMAYATVLKDVGVLYQTMYLVATAMGLAPCALGAGNADRFVAAAGTDYLTESSVGEFMLGARAG